MTIVTAAIADDPPVDHAVVIVPVAEVLAPDQLM